MYVSDGTSPHTMCPSIQMQNVMRYSRDGFDMPSYCIRCIRHAELPAKRHKHLDTVYPCLDALYPCLDRYIKEMWSEGLEHSLLQSTHSNHTHACVCVFACMYVNTEPTKELVIGRKGDDG